MGERGPKPDIVKRLTPGQRAELDEAIVEGRQTKTDLYERFGRAQGVSYSAFCNYAAQLESRARHRYVGELLNKTFGNLPDSDIDVRAKGIVMAVLDRLAADVLHDGELKPKDLRDVVQAYDLLRRGAIAEAQEERRNTEWEVVRMGTVAEAATWIIDRLKAEVGDDPELYERLQRLVADYCARIDRPEDRSLAAKLIGDVAKRLNWKKSVAEVANLIWGLPLPGDHGARVLPTELPPGGTRQRARDIYGLPEEDRDDAAAAGGKPTRGDVCQVIDDYVRGNLTEDDLR